MYIKHDITVMDNTDLYKALRELSPNAFKLYILLRVKEFDYVEWGGFFEFENEEAMMELLNEKNIEILRSFLELRDKQYIDAFFIEECSGFHNKPNYQSQGWYSWFIYEVNSDEEYENEEKNMQERGVWQETEWCIEKGGLNSDTIKPVLDSYDGDDISIQDLFAISRRKPLDPYLVYLRSPHWLEIREETLAKSGHTCSKCGTTVNLNVHHLNYDNLGHEKEEDLIVLCRKCHREEHKI